MGFTMKKDSVVFFFFSIYLPFATFLTALTGLVRHSSTGLSKRGHQCLFFSVFFFLILKPMLSTFHYSG